MVSLVCALEGQVEVDGASGQSLVVDEGGCAASKPAEGLYLAGGTGQPLPVVSAGPPGGTALPAPVGAAGSAGLPSAPGSAPVPATPVSQVLAAAGPPPPVAGAAGPRFSPSLTPPVGAGPSLALSVSPGLPGIQGSNPFLRPCDSPSTGCGLGGAAGNPPTNPFRPIVP